MTHQLTHYKAGLLFGSLPFLAFYPLRRDRTIGRFSNIQSDSALYFTIHFLLGRAHDYSILLCELNEGQWDCDPMFRLFRELVQYAD